MARRVRSQTAPGSRQEERLLKASEILGQILRQDVGRHPEAGSRIREGTSGERICSVHDPEMRHSRKSARTRFDGHKLAFAADVESQLVVAADVLAGNAKDDQGSLELAQQAETRSGLELDAALGDCAYGTGPNRERFTEAGVSLLAKVPARSETGYSAKTSSKSILRRAPAAVRPAGAAAICSLLVMNSDRMGRGCLCRCSSSRLACVGPVLSGIAASNPASTAGLSV